MKKLALITLAVAVLPATAFAQAPAARLDAEAATKVLIDWGLTDIQLDEQDDGDYEFEARTASGANVDIDLGLDGRLLKLDLDDDDARRGDTGLVAILPAEVQAVLTERGIVDLHEFEAGRSAWSVEGYSAEGREIEIEIAYAQSAAQTAPDLAAVLKSVKAAGYTTEGEPIVRDRFVEILATNPEGEKVTLHADFDGVVYRELLRR